MNKTLDNSKQECSEILDQNVDLFLQYCKDCYQHELDRFDWFHSKASWYFGIVVFLSGFTGLFAKLIFVDKIGSQAIRIVSLFFLVVTMLSLAIAGTILFRCIRIQSIETFSLYNDKTGVMLYGNIKKTFSNPSKSKLKESLGLNYLKTAKKNYPIIRKMSQNLEDSYEQISLVIILLFVDISLWAIWFW